MLKQEHVGDIRMQHKHCIGHSTAMWQHIHHDLWTPNMLRPQWVYRKSEKTHVGDNNNMHCTCGPWGVSSAEPQAVAETVRITAAVGFISVSVPNLNFSRCSMSFVLLKLRALESTSHFWEPQLVPNPKCTAAGYGAVQHVWYTSYNGTL